MALIIEQISHEKLDARTKTKTLVNMKRPADTYTAVTFRSPGALQALMGDATRVPDNDGTVTIRLGDVVRTHYGFSSVAACLRDIYGL